MLKKFIGCSRKDLVGKFGFDRGCFNSSLYNRTIVSGKDIWTFVGTRKKKKREN